MKYRNAKNRRLKAHIHATYMSFILARALEELRGNDDDALCQLEQKLSRLRLLQQLYELRLGQYKGPLISTADRLHTCGTSTSVSSPRCQEQEDLLATLPRAAYPPHYDSSTLDERHHRLPYHDIHNGAERPEMEGSAPTPLPSTVSPAHCDCHTATEKCVQYQSHTRDKSTQKQDPALPAPPSAAYSPQYNSHTVDERHSRLLQYDSCTVDVQSRQVGSPVAILPSSAYPSHYDSHTAAAEKTQQQGSPLEILPSTAYPSPYDSRTEDQKPQEQGLPKHTQSTTSSLSFAQEKACTFTSAQELHAMGTIPLSHGNDSFIHAAVVEEVIDPAVPSNNPYSFVRNPGAPIRNACAPISNACAPISNACAPISKVCTSISNACTPIDPEQLHKVTREVLSNLESTLTAAPIHQVKGPVAALNGLKDDDENAVCHLHKALKSPKDVSLSTVFCLNSNVASPLERPDDINVHAIPCSSSNTTPLDRSANVNQSAMPHSSRNMAPWDQSSDVNQSALPCINSSSADPWSDVHAHLLHRSSSSAAPLDGPSEVNRSAVPCSSSNSVPLNQPNDIKTEKSMGHEIEQKGLSWRLCLPSSILSLYQAFTIPCNLTQSTPLPNKTPISGARQFYLGLLLSPAESPNLISHKNSNGTTNNMTAASPSAAQQQPNVVNPRAVPCSSSNMAPPVRSTHIPTPASPSAAREQNILTYLNFALTPSEPSLRLVSWVHLRDVSSKKYSQDDHSGRVYQHALALLDFEAEGVTALVTAGPLQPVTSSGTPLKAADFRKDQKGAQARTTPTAGDLMPDLDQIPKILREGEGRTMRSAGEAGRTPTGLKARCERLLSNTNKPHLEQEGAGTTGHELHVLVSCSVVTELAETCRKSGKAECISGGTQVMPDLDLDQVLKISSEGGDHALSEISGSMRVACTVVSPVAASCITAVGNMLISGGGQGLVYSWQIKCTSTSTLPSATEVHKTSSTSHRHDKHCKTLAIHPDVHTTSFTRHRHDELGGAHVIHPESAVASERFTVPVIQAGAAVSLPQARYNNIPFNDLLELRPVHCGCPSSGPRHSRLLVGVSSGGAVAVWDVTARQLLMAAAHHMSHICSLEPLLCQCNHFDLVNKLRSAGNHGFSTVLGTSLNADVGKTEAKISDLGYELHDHSSLPILTLGVLRNRSVLSSDTSAVDSQVASLVIDQDGLSIGAPVAPPGACSVSLCDGLAAALLADGKVVIWRALEGGLCAIWDLNSQSAATGHAGSAVLGLGATTQRSVQMLPGGLCAFTSGRWLCIELLPQSRTLQGVSI